MEVSWQVTGIPKDAYANAHSIPVEVAKPFAEQGRCLYSELFGESPATAIRPAVPTS